MAVKKKNKAAVTLGRTGGKKTSAAKAAAVRENGKKGGRPPKKGKLGAVVPIPKRTELMIELLKTVPVSTAMTIWDLFRRKLELNIGDFETERANLTEKVQ